jgi:hypothetical protein
MTHANGSDHTHLLGFNNSRIYIGTRHRQHLQLLRLGTGHQGIKEPLTKWKFTFGTAAWKLMLVAGDSPVTWKRAMIITTPGLAAEV